jgi:MFS family permease
MTTDSPVSGRDFGSTPYRWYVLLTLTLVYTLNFIDRALLGVLAQPVITTFGLSDTQFGFLAGPPFALFYALMGIPIAMAADRYNRIAIIALCIALWSLMTALCGLADGFLFLLIARVGVAIGEAGSNPPSNSVIADYYRPSESLVDLLDRRHVRHRPRLPHRRSARPDAGRPSGRGP